MAVRPVTAFRSSRWRHDSREIFPTPTLKTCSVLLRRIACSWTWSGFQTVARVMAGVGLSLVPSAQFLKGKEMQPTPKPGSGLQTIAFDLDGVLAEATWPKPDVGAPIQQAIDALLRYHDQDYEIVIYTARPASHADAIWRWLRAQGLADVVYDVRTDKLRYAMLVDDRAVTFPEAFQCGNEVIVTEGDKRRKVIGATWCSRKGCDVCR